MSLHLPSIIEYILSLGGLLPLISISSDGLCPNCADLNYRDVFKGKCFTKETTVDPTDVDMAGNMVVRQSNPYQTWTWALGSLECALCRFWLDLSHMIDSEVHPKPIIQSLQYYEHPFDRDHSNFLFNPFFVSSTPKQVIGLEDSGAQGLVEPFLEIFTKVKKLLSNCEVFHHTSTCWANQNHLHF